MEVMTLSDETEIAIAKDYFRLADAGDPKLMDLFHEDANFVFIPGGDRVAVEGVSARQMSGMTWSGGTTRGGRFCNVFEFRGDRIARLHVSRWSVLRSNE